MRRLSQSAGVAVMAFLVLAFATPAGAKGVPYDHGEIRGPGLRKAIVVPNRYPYLMNGELFEMVAGNFPARFVPPASYRGPRYDLIYHLEDGGQVLVHFYPYAQPDPIGFVPRGQVVQMRSIYGPSPVRLDSDWYDYSPRLVELLQERGLPPPNDATPIWMSVLVAAALIVLSMVLMWRVSRLRRIEPRPA